MAAGTLILSLDERDWPTFPQQISDLSDSDPKVRKECTALTLQSNGEEDSIKTLITRYSSWYRLLVGVACIKRFLRWCQRKWTYGRNEDRGH